MNRQTDHRDRLVFPGVGRAVPPPPATACSPSLEYTWPDIYCEERREKRVNAPCQEEDVRPDGEGSGGQASSGHSVLVSLVGSG